MRRTGGRGRGPARHDQGGAALVEFALVVPILFTILLGIFSGGIAYNRKLQMTGAVREAARTAATIAASQTFTNGGTWAQNVTQIVKDRVGTDLGSTYTICVSLIEGAGGSPANTVVSTPNAQSSYNLVTTVTNGVASTSSPGTACNTTEGYSPYAAGIDVGRRVQVVVTRPTTIQALLFSSSITLRAAASSKSESSS